jgi:lysine-specific demethylase 3
MLDELEREFDVRPFTIVQFEGDGVFIPAGAPHMVRNLNSCIKVALDFVSPHGAAQCLLITEQLRLLSDTHVNREDKLQIKNIIYQNVLRCLNGLQSHQVSAAVSVPQPPPLKSFYGSFYD